MVVDLRHHIGLCILIVVVKYPSISSMCTPTHATHPTRHIVTSSCMVLQVESISQDP